MRLAKRLPSLQDRLAIPLDGTDMSLTKQSSKFSDATDPSFYVDR